MVHILEKKMKRIRVENKEHKKNKKRIPIVTQYIPFSFYVVHYLNKLDSRI